MTITDGHENQSREINREQVTTAIAAKEAEGWPFVFLGAAPDNYDEAGHLGYSPGNVQQWSAEGRGAALAFDTVSKSAVKRRKGDEVASRDFFDGDTGAAGDRKRRKGGGGA